MGLGKKPKAFNVKKFTAIWIISNSNGGDDIDPLDMTSEQMEACTEFLSTQPKKVKAKYLNALEEEKRKARDRMDAHNDQLRGILGIYNRKIDAYNHAMETGILRLAKKYDTLLLSGEVLRFSFQISSGPLINQRTAG
jgi:hypothetical protein